MVSTESQTSRQTIPARGDRIPDFSGIDPDGDAKGTRDFYMRRNLALVFTHEPGCADCRDLLQGLATEYRAIMAEAGDVLAVVAGSADVVRKLRGDLDLPFPIVIDEDGSIHKRYGLWQDGQPQAALFAVDRYGTIFNASIADADHEMLAASEVPGWLEFIACRCT